MQDYTLSKIIGGGGNSDALYNGIMAARINFWESPWWETNMQQIKWRMGTPATMQRTFWQELTRNTGIVICGSDVYNFLEYPVNFFNEYFHKFTLILLA